MRNGQEAVADLAHQLMTETGDRVNLYLRDYLKTPQLVNRLNANAVRLGQVDPTNAESLRRHFVQQIQTLDSVSRIHFSNPQGGYVSTGRDERGLSTATTDNFVKGRLRVYSVDPQGNRRQLLVERPDYDASQRPFYQKGIEAGQPVWTPIYIYVPAARGLGISASYPLYDPKQGFQGVLSSDLTLVAIQEFLGKLRVGTNGTAFIVERSGWIVASSTSEKPFSFVANNGAERLRAIDSNERSIRAAAQHLIARFGDLSNIRTATQLQFDLEGKRQFLQVMPFKDESGLDWLIAITVPETDFMGRIQTNTRVTILFSLGALLGAISLGLGLSRVIVRPIQRLGQASLTLAEGEWDKTLEQTSAIAELQVLGTSFNRMAIHLQQSFDRVKIALQESEEKFTQVFRTCPDPIGIVRLDGRYVDVNDAFLDLFGYHREEVIGHKATEVGHWVNPEDRERYVDLVQSGQPVQNLEFTFRTKSGRPLTILFSADCIELRGQTYLVGIAKDITDRKGLELALERSEAKLNDVLNSVVASITSFQLFPDRRWEYQYWSEGCEAVFGYRAEEFLANPTLWISQVLPEDLEQGRVVNLDELMVDRPTTLEGEYRFRHKDGSLRWISYRIRSRPMDEPPGWAATVFDVDITALKQTELELLKQKELREAIYNESTDALFLVDPKTLLITDCNWRAVELFEAGSKTELIGIEGRVLQRHPFTSGEVDRIVADMEEKGYWSQETEYVTRKGNLFWGNLTAKPIQIANQLIHLVQVTDITERKLAEEALRNSEARFQKIAAASPAQIYILTCQPDGSGMRFEYISPGIREIQELEPEQVLENPLLTYKQVHPDDIKDYNEIAYRSFQTLQPFSHEWRIITPSGELKWVRANSRPERQPNGEIVWYGVMLDVTERKLAEEALRQSEERNRAILSAIPDLMKLYTVDGVYLDSIKSHSTFDLIPDNPELVGKHIRELVPEAIATTQIQLMKKAVATGEVQVYEQQVWIQDTLQHEEIRIVPCSHNTALLLIRNITDRKQAEQALRRSEATLRRAQQVAHIGSWELNVQTGQVTWSEESFHIFGWDETQPEPTLPQFYALIHPDDRAALQQAVSQIMADGKSYRVEFRTNHPQNAWRYVEARAEAIQNEQGQVVQLAGTNLDITERHQAETALRQSEATKNQILKAIPDLIIWMASDGTCLDMIEGSNVRNLYIRSEAIGKNLYDLLPFDVAEARRNAIQQALQTGEVQVYEQQVETQDKTYYEEVRVIGVGGDRILVIVRDITGRKQAEAALLDSETRFRSAFQDAPIGMALISLDNRWIKVNPMLCDMLGFPESELLTMTASSLVHPHDREPFQQAIQQVLSSENRNAQVELRYCCQEGRVAWALMSLSLVRDAQAQPLYYVAQIQDITERQAIDRMKDEFISIVSHELRTPLTAIRGFLGLLDTGIYDRKPDRAKHMVGQALINTERLVRLVNDILDLERLSSGGAQFVLEDCDAENLLRQAVAGVQSIADQANITLTIVPTVAQVWADSDSIIQTLTNLLSNAIKFSPPDSIVTLSAQTQTEWVLFSVSDRGRGIPEDKLETIFGRFEQVDVSDSRQKGGTGLGLAICQNIVKAHGGNIWAESALGEGSVFYFTLPLPSKTG